MTALRYMIWKEFLQIRRSRPMIAITLGVPIVQLLILGFAISGDIIHVPAVVTDLDRTPMSRSLISRLDNTRYLDILYRLDDVRGAEHLLQHNNAILSVTIPRDFGKKLVRGEQAQVSIMADAQNSNVALIGSGYVMRIIQSWAASTFATARGGSVVPFPVVNLESRILYNPEMKSAFFMIPGIIVLLVTVTTVLLTALGIVREREGRNTLEQIMVTPITRLEIILGKTLPFVLIGLVEFTMALFVAKLVYHIPIEGSLVEFYFMTIVFIISTVGFGIIISTFAHTQMQALFTAWFILMFCVLMSGFFLPLDSMPKAMYYLTFVNPLRYYLTIVRELFLKGSGITLLWPHVLALAGIGCVVFTAAVERFHKRLG